MKKTRLAAALAPALLLLCPESASAQRAVFVVRHAEKAADASDRDVPLSEAGDARAARLAALLKDAGVTVVYSTDTVRARATAEPLARAIRRPVQLYADVAALAGALHTNSEAVALVVGHSNTVPQLLASLGVGAKIEIGDKEYDNLFVVVPKASGPPVLLRLRY